MKRFNLVALLGIIVLMAFNSCGLNKGTDNKITTEEFSGAGATFPLPFYNMIFENYNKKQGSQVAYGGIGSGGGIRNLKDEIVDFAGSDAYVSDEEMKDMKPVIHIPTCMGAVVVAYNIEGVSELNLSGSVVADIFAGNIRKWNDIRIKELNPEATLPDKEIVPVYRSDGSGTTFVFTDYLSKVSETWANKYGKGKSVNFPIGQAAKGNPGVAGVIAETENAIGYIGSEYAFAQKIPYASITNANGEIVKPTAESISAAASAKIPEDTRTMITNSTASGAYPISCFTWIVLYQEQNYADRTKKHAQELVAFLSYILSDEAQKCAEQVHYAPLPKEVIELSIKNLKKITYDGSTIITER